MLHFFRRIRQTLLSNNKYSKYMLYAIGEIALVMIGILLAMQVNNWNQNRININSARISLELLNEDIEEDLEQIETLQESVENIIDHGEGIILQIQNVKPLDKTIFTSLLFTVKEQSFQANRSGLETLRNSGELGYLPENLQKSIVEYYNLVENIQERESISNAYIKNVHEPYLIRQYSEVIRIQTGEPILQKLYEQDRREKPILDASALISDSQLEMLIAARYLQSMKMKEQYESTTKTGQLLAKQIQTYLSNY